tara:strand:- start:154 stop:426 length:273 start_codon:yes stop_codon:yes gene_type:complete
MKKLLGIVVLGLLLSGCGGGRGSESGVLAAVIGFVGLIGVMILLAPFGPAISKASKIKDDKARNLVMIIIAIGIIFVLATVPGWLGTAMR